MPIGNSIPNIAVLTFNQFWLYSGKDGLFTSTVVRCRTSALATAQEDPLKATQLLPAEDQVGPVGGTLIMVHNVPSLQRTRLVKQGTLA